MSSTFSEGTTLLSRTLRLGSMPPGGEAEFKIRGAGVVREGSVAGCAVYVAHRIDEVRLGGCDFRKQEQV